MRREIAIQEAQETYNKDLAEKKRKVQQAKLKQPHEELEANLEIEQIERQAALAGKRAELQVIEQDLNGSGSNINNVTNVLQNNNDGIETTQTTTIDYAAQGARSKVSYIQSRKDQSGSPLSKMQLTPIRTQEIDIPFQNYPWLQPNVVDVGTNV